MKLKIPLLIITALVTGNAFAQKTYRPEELQGMVRNGNYPNQGAVVTQSQVMDFALCKQKIGVVIDAVGTRYPNRIIVDTAIVFTQKLWTNDAAMTMTCSLLDKKMVITTAPYR